jgi:hypothetical protein
MMGIWEDRKNGRVDERKVGKLVKIQPSSLSIFQTPRRKL